MAGPNPRLSASVAWMVYCGTEQINTMISLARECFQCDTIFQIRSVDQQIRVYWHSLQVKVPFIIGLYFYFYEVFAWLKET